MSEVEMSTEAEKQDATVNPVEVAKEAAVARQRIKNEHPRPVAEQVTERVKNAGASGDSARSSASRPAKKATAKKASSSKSEK